MEPRSGRASCPGFTLPSSGFLGNQGAFRPGAAELLASYIRNSASAPQGAPYGNARC